MIRPAEIKDIPDIMRLLYQVAKVHQKDRPDLFRADTSKYSENELTQILSDRERPIFVSENAEGQVEGYAFCIIKETKGDRLLHDMRTLYIDDLCVDEKARRRHIGRELYEHTLKYAKDIGCYNVTLNVWALNRSARKFYERMGLTEQKIGLEQILE